MNLQLVEKYSGATKKTFKISKAKTLKPPPPLNNVTKAGTGKKSKTAHVLTTSNIIKGGEDFLTECRYHWFINNIIIIKFNCGTDKAHEIIFIYLFILYLKVEKHQIHKSVYIKKIAMYKVTIYTC